MIELKTLPPREALEFFRQKGYAIGFDYRDVWQQQHQAAFTVAKAMRLDILKDIRAEVDRALAEGTTFQDFQKRLTPTLQAKGWWGKQEMRDPLTGEMKVVQLGSPRRLKLIYDTNLRQAHSEGQWRRIQERKASFPFLQYDGGNSGHTSRPQHLAWDGLVLPVDDPFWQSHMPVRELNCKCRVIPLSRGQLQRQGLEVGESPEVESRPYVNKRTGEVQMVPDGVHPMFHYPPGGRRASLNRHLVEKLEGVPPAMARAAVDDLVRGRAFSEWYRQPAGDFPVGVLAAEVAERLGARSQLLVMTEATLATQLAEQAPITLDDYALVQALLDGGRAIRQADGSLAYLLEQADGSLLVLTATGSGPAVLLGSLRRLAADDPEVLELLRGAK
ncbi:MAG: phage minor head protein [Pseudomonas sp.]|nr:phage minor head protein [Pseudomonas sp.]